MADEITVSLQLRATKGSLKFDSTQISKRYTMNGTTKTANTQVIGTSHEALVFGADTATLGWSVFTNLDATNYVEIGPVVSATFYPILKLKAGESSIQRLGSTALYARANTASVSLDMSVLAD